MALLHVPLRDSIQSCAAIHRQERFQRFPFSPPKLHLIHPKSFSVNQIFPVAARATVNPVWMVTLFGKKRALTVLENTVHRERDGESSTKPPFPVAVDLVAAARFCGGQLFVLSTAKLSHYPGSR